MAAYSILASFYDLLTEDIDYKMWANFVESLLIDQGFAGKNILELGCGTGRLTLPFLEKGYEVVGIDSSIEMLDLASSKIQEHGQKCILLNQNLLEIDLEIYEIEAVVAGNDVFNYILDEEDLVDLFKFLFAHMAVNGVLVFDMSTGYKLKHILGDNTFGESFDHMAYLWENDYNNEDGCLQMLLNFFVKDEEGYKRHEEEHIQKGYDAELIQELLQQVGFRAIQIHSDFSLKPGVNRNAQRLFFSCKK